MIHLLLEPGPWFRAKSHGIGAGLPFKWQGWALLTAHLAMITGLALAKADSPAPMLALTVLAALAPMPIYAARTEGGWHWRWGTGTSRDTSRRK